MSSSSEKWDHIDIDVLDVEEERSIASSLHDHK